MLFKEARFLEANAAPKKQKPSFPANRRMKAFSESPPALAGGLASSFSLTEKLAPKTGP